jgi:hypothetical protein
MVGQVSLPCEEKNVMKKHSTDYPIYTSASFGLENQVE